MEESQFEEVEVLDLLVMQNIWNNITNSLAAWLSVFIDSCDVRSVWKAMQQAYIINIFEY